MRADIICIMFPITIIALMYCAEDMAMNELAYQSTVTQRTTLGKNQWSTLASSMPVVSHLFLV